MSNFSLSIHQTGLSAQQTLLNDYRLAWISREASLLGRKEVLTGKAKFGIFGDGFVVLDQLRAVDKSRLVRRLGAADRGAIAKIKRTIKEMLVD